MVKVLYKLFIALMIALFVGFGISVFYPEPKAPDYPQTLEYKTTPDMTVEQKQVQIDYDNQMKIYQQDFATHSRNVSAIAIGFSILILIISLTLLLKIEVIGDGILLGSLFTLLYGIIRGFMSDNSKFQFGVVTVGLVVGLVLGYIEFIRPLENARTKK